MQRSILKKILFLVAGIAIVFLLLPFEYDNHRAKTLLYPLIWISIPIIIYKFISIKNRITKYILAAIGSLIYLLFSIVFWLVILGFCAWGNEYKLYVNKHDSSVSIINRGYSCFETDDDYYCFKERKLTDHLKYVTDFDKTKVDTSEWKSIY